MCNNIYIYIHTQTHKHTNTQTHKHTNTQTHKHTNTHAHTHTHTHIRLYTYITSTYGLRSPRGRTNGDPSKIDKQGRSTLHQTQQVSLAPAERQRPRGASRPALEAFHIAKNLESGRHRESHDIIYHIIGVCVPMYTYMMCT